MVIPPFRVSCCLCHTNNHKRIQEAADNSVSGTKFTVKLTGVTRAVVPTTNKILKILLPTIFPIAISAFPFNAADTEVTSSGREVPKATIVSPMILSLKPSVLAMALAASTLTSLPQTMRTRPNTAPAIILHKGIG